jgi:hypothetical protein
MSQRFRFRALMALLAVAMLTLAVPRQASAWWQGNVWIAPPVVVPPPMYYSPPPVAYPYGYQQPYAQTYIQREETLSCHAGSYSCPLDRPMNPGQNCFCVTNQGTRSYGVVQ